MSSRYDRAVTIFSPDGHLLQVEYAQEAVRKGSTCVGVLGKDCVVLGVEKKTVAQLQDERTIKKICSLDNHILMAFAGLTADARVLVSRAQIECQSHRLNLEDSCTLEYITRFIANLKQKYTQSNGRRPFGISCLLGGFDPDGMPHLFQTEPSGIYYEWKAAATGRSGKEVREYFEKEYSDEMVATKRAAVKLAVKALMEMAQSPQDNIEIAVIEYQKPYEMIERQAIIDTVNQIQKEKAEAELKKQGK